MAEDPRLRRRAAVLVLLLNLVAILLAWRRKDDSAAAAPISFADGAHITPQAAASQHLGAIDASHWSLARELLGDEWRPAGSAHFLPDPTTKASSS